MIRKFSSRSSPGNVIAKARINSNLPKKIVTKPDVDSEKPRDLRTKFLSQVNIRLLTAVMQFASDYVHGTLKLNALSQMNCSDLKQEEIVEKTSCDLCNEKFRRESKFLYCLADHSINPEDETKRHKKFRFICKKCSADYMYSYQYELFQMYPVILLDNLEILCQMGFLKCYIFDINLKATVTTEEFSIEGHHDYYDVIQRIVASKKQNERITKLELRTYGNTLFLETNQNCGMQLRIDSTPDKKIYDITFGPYESSMMRFFEKGQQRELTYFYNVEKQVYSQPFNYVVYFPVQCKRFCSLCTKHKMYLKHHLVLYCSQCGFTDSMFFNAKTHKIDLSKMKFFYECVKVKTIKPKRIYYYDMTLYKKLNM
ncbi:ME53 [Chrysodeixis includens nucleopolyhedrovirus]|uniref:ME53 n=1 Tax=Chrysodeixis includens nucleopolyhedrovirus TaxID=1207438 RepID=A0A5B8YRN5_9ABAC|nr:ME53 [Chrysodeixis includens nucleopolyhedrovirus]QED40536.1 ME53 [Chrysodeixis includens nucleopolyhedrovirus]